MSDDVFVWTLIWRAATDAFAGARVAEEILWMNGATWAQLWSGAIGAVAGAGVAMHVLRKTLREQTNLAARNEQIQRELADAAATTQAALARQQLKEQRQALERQLAEQRDALRLQLDEQRREASLNREHAAIAEVIAAVSDSVQVAISKVSDDDRSTMARIAATTGRWQIESIDAELRKELQQWASHWYKVVTAKRRPSVRGLTDDKAWELMADTIRGMLKVSRHWTHSSAEERTQLISDMETVRQALPPKVTRESAATVVGPA